MRGEAITEPAEVYSTDEYSEEDQDEGEGKEKWWMNQKLPIY